MILRLRACALLALWLSSTTPALAQLDSSCTASLLNRSVQVTPAGTFAISNVPFAQGLFRVRITCQQEATTVLGQSELVPLVASGLTRISDIDFQSIDPLPTAIQVDAPKPSLETPGQSTQLRATATFDDGSTADVTNGSSGTLWASSNPDIASVDADGRVTAVASGIAFIQARHQGVLASFQIAVALGADRDMDGLPDDFEAANGLDPDDASDAALDPDGDGLTHLQEFTAGTALFVPDTDGDGLDDGTEVSSSETDPGNPDSDTDGLLDGDEIALGSDPLDADSDDDGLPDGLEVALTGSPIAANPFGDPDGDALDNVAEARLFTDPLDPDTDGDGLGDGEEVFANTDPLTPDGMAPSVSLASPTAGAELVEGELISIEATAQDDGRVERVTFFVDGVDIGNVTQSPFRLEYRIPAGVAEIVISALAVDTNGNSAASATLRFAVIGDPRTMVVGRVVDFFDAGIEGVRVSVHGQQAVTTATGEFTIPDVPSNLGPIQVRAELSDGTRNAVGLSRVLDPVRGDVTDVGTFALGLAGSLYPSEQYTTEAIAFQVADLDGDGFLDLVTSFYWVFSSSTSTIRVRFGTEDGRFGPEAQRIPLHSRADRTGDVTVADLDGDGHLDIVSAGGRAVTVLLGSDGRVFQGPATFNIGGAQTLSGVTVADLDGDRVPDIAVTKTVSNEVATLIGVGDGSFLPGAVFPVGARPGRVTAADIDADGAQDLVAANSGESSVSVLFGVGDGTFEAAVAFAVGASPSDLDAVDVDADGDVDLVTVNSDGGNVAVLANAGNRAFDPPAFTASGDRPVNLAVGDIDLDGVPDIAASGLQGVWIGLGEGDGTFQSSDLVASGLSRGVALADLDRDGATDLLYGVNSDRIRTITVHPGDGNGTFRRPEVIEVGRSPETVAIGDLDGDGLGELLIANSSGNDVSVLSRVAGGGFELRDTLGVGLAPNDLELADVSGDGNLDVVVANRGSNSVTVLLGSATGTLRTGETTGVGVWPVAIAVADLNGDGARDVVTANRGFVGAGDPGVSVIIGDGAGGAMSSVSSSLPGLDVQGLSVADVDSDGVQDIVVVGARFPRNELRILRGLGDGTVVLSSVLPLLTQQGDLSVATTDLNLDGNVDVVVSNRGFVSRLQILLGNGDGTFDEEELRPTSALSGGLSLEDVDADGVPDIVASGTGIFLLRGLGDGTFEEELRYSTLVRDEAVRIGVGDIDGDGQLDFATANRRGDTVSVLIRESPKLGE